MRARLKLPKTPVWFGLRPGQGSHLFAEKSQQDEIIEIYVDAGACRQLYKGDGEREGFSQGSVRVGKGILAP